MWCWLNSCNTWHKSRQWSYRRWWSTSTSLGACRSTTHPLTVTQGSESAPVPCQQKAAFTLAILTLCLQQRLQEQKVPILSSRQTSGLRVGKARTVGHLLIKWAGWHLSPLMLFISITHTSDLCLAPSQHRAFAHTLLTQILSTLSLPG